MKTGIIKNKSLSNVDWEMLMVDRSKQMTQSDSLSDQNDGDGGVDRLLNKINDK